jgi:hypothetical protein
MCTDLKAFRKSGLANCFGRQQSIEGRVPVLVPRTAWTSHISCLPSGGSYQSHVLTPHSHSAAKRHSFPNNAPAYACSAASVRGITGGWDRRDRAPLSSRRPVSYPRGKKGDHRGDGRVGSPCDLEGALREVGPCLVAQSHRVPPFNACEDGGCRNHLRTRTSLQPYCEQTKRTCQGEMPLEPARCAEAKTRRRILRTNVFALK